MVEASKKKTEEFREFIRPIIDEIRKTGVQTLKGISECLNRRGIPTKTGKTVWYPSTVRCFV